MKLPNDVARCDGIPQHDNPEKMWECFQCLRRIAQKTDRRGVTVAYMQPPEFKDGVCPERIEK